MNADELAKRFNADVAKALKRNTGTRYSQLLGMRVDSVEPRRAACSRSSAWT